MGFCSGILNKLFCSPSFGLQNQIWALNASSIPPDTLQKGNKALKWMQRLQTIWFDGELFMCSALLVELELAMG